MVVVRRGFLAWFFKEPFFLHPVKGPLNCGLRVRIVQFCSFKGSEEAHGRQRCGIPSSKR